MISAVDKERIVRAYNDPDSDYYEVADALAIPRVCVSTIHRALEGQLITLKKLENVPRERNREDVKVAHKEHCEWLLQGQEGNGELEELV